MTQQLFAAVRSEYPADGRNFGYCDEWVELFPTLAQATELAEEWANLERGNRANIRIEVAQGFASGEYGETLLLLRAAK